MRVPWKFDGYDWPINPEKDNGWTYEQVMTEAVPINSPKSSLQFGGVKSGRRQVSGWIWGPSAPTFFAKLRAWQRSRTKATLIDHLGNTNSAILLRFEPELIQSASEWTAGRQTWRYTAEFIEA